MIISVTLALSEWSTFYERKSPMTSIDELIGEDHAGVLRGLAPSLVGDLAKFAGSSIDDLRVSFQVMPFGDRVTLKAYGFLSESERGHLIVEPEMLDLIGSAAALAIHSGTSGVKLDDLLSIE